MTYWAYQVELLEKILPFLEDRHVLVIHFRGMEGDCSTEAFLLLLYVLKRYVRTHHPIHLHCFTGNRYVQDRWLERFPGTYFGFNNEVRKFSSDQLEALQNVEDSRLLLETDAPYFPAPGSRVSSPSQISTVAEAVTALRGTTVEHVLEISVANGKHLYRSQ
ncbi:uncharacterized metal-dependent hydrolase YcfH-like [Dreissena polymorpha]|uniref:Uncharacterized protein n=1 Tax=Dreissena polymorpha TaxID=45954 RepID=A0A9D4G6S1_DREPO|nr:uncharacterized metal-dependent hydrolase YcfH-like [Dreissena polymorpha]KAH3811585.1 hypothetical protein DPMN_139995 [Dreissena polymorpha]